MPAPGDLKDVLAQLRERYLAGSGATLRAFEELATQLERAPGAPEVVQALRRELHRVRGTAGSYGFLETSRLAAALEPVAVRWAGDPELDRTRRARIVRQFVASLRASLHTGETSAPGEGPGRGSLLLVGLPDVHQSRIAAEALHQGFAAEVLAAEDVAKVAGGRRGAAVVATPATAPAVPTDCALVVLREGAESMPALGPHAVVLDAAASAREILATLTKRAITSPLVGATVLVIEDDEQMASLLRAIAERQGMFVESRGDANDIRATLDAVRPAIVLLDINLPGSDGFAVMRQVRQEERFRELPVIMMSASTDVETRSAAFAAGADDFQSKPVSPEELLRRVERQLEGHRQRLLARGVHPVVGLLLPERAQQVLGASVATLASRAEPATVGLVRPVAAVDGLATSAAWHRELRLLAGALAAEGTRLGFRDDVAMLMVMPMGAADALARLELFAEASEGDLLPWCAGIVELRPGAEPSLPHLAKLAEEAWQLARERNQRVHVWDPADAGVAPDVIVVEDDDAMADLVTFALSARGLTWHRYSDGPAALAGLLAMRVQGRSPVVLMDVDLPGLDGFSLFERLRVERPGVFRVVFASVHGSEADQLRAIRAGALDYLVKPVSLRVLIAKIVSWRAGLGPA